MLGTVCVDTLTGPLPLGPAKRRSLLAALLLRANTPVSMARLTDCLWDDAPPLHARTVIQGHVSRLRALLTGADAEAYGVELATLGDAYVLRAPETLLDSQRFEELLMLAREQRSPADTVLMLKEALSLWQGPALTGTYASTPLQAAAHALEESRLTTVEQLAHAYAVLGEHHRAAAVLRAEADAQPLRESLAAALMTALYRSGRQSEALDRFHRTRRLLADELGIDPGRELADAYAQILRGDPDPAAAGQGAGPEPEPESRRTAGVSGPVAPPRPRAPCRRRTPGDRRTPPICCRGLRAVSTGAAPNSPLSPGRRRARRPSVCSPGRPASARPRWPCTGRAGPPPPSRTGGSSRICAGSATPVSRPPSKSCASSCSPSVWHRAGSRSPWPAPRRSSAR